MTMRQLAAIVLTLIILPLSSIAEDRQRLTADVLWQLSRVGQPVVAPNGDRVVVPVTDHDDESGDPETRLWLLDMNGGQRPLTAAGATASSPAFSGDGKSLAFVSKRDKDEAGQIYVLPMDGPGEAVKLSDMPTGVGSLKWVGDQIYFVSNVWPDMTMKEMAERVKADEESKVSAYVWNELPYSYWDHYIKEERQNHLYRMPAGGGEVEALTPATGLQLSRSDAGSDSYDVAPDGKTVAFVANSQIGEVYANYDVYLLSIGSAEAKNISDENPAADGSPMFSPDGKKLAYGRQQIPGFYGDQVKPVIYDLSSGKATSLHTDWDRSATGLVWSPDSRGFYGAIGDAGTQRIYFLPANNGKPKAITGNTDYGQLSIANDGTLVAVNQSPLYPSRVVSVAKGGRDIKRLDSFNDEILANVDVGSYESVTYTGADGDEIQMWVHYPPGFDSGQKYPLYLLIHGGPHGAVTENFHFRWNAQTFSSWGYVTAWPNFHGSSSFGQAFTDSINPDWMTKPYADVIAAADWLMEQAWIDNERVVAGGGSYGGYLSSILLGKEHPFNALVIHAAVYDLFAQTSADFAVHDQRFGPYWENPEMYQQLSPHMYADKFETPSLIIHGQTDLRVPVGQAFELFRTLQRRGVESRLVYYPDENHWILTRDNSKHWHDEVRNWIGKFAEPGPKAR